MLGALVSKEHMAKVKGYIDLARSEGCSIMCGDGLMNLPQDIKNVRCHLHSACTTVKPLIMDTPIRGQPPYNGQTACPFH